jgi:hypothetical protein
VELSCIPEQIRVQVVIVKVTAPQGDGADTIRKAVEERPIVHDASDGIPIRFEVARIDDELKHSNPVLPQAEKGYQFREVEALSRLDVHFHDLATTIA